jgi:hypothetical protein
VPYSSRAYGLDEPCWRVISVDIASPGCGVYSNEARRQHQLQQHLPSADGKFKEIPFAFSDVTSALLTTILVRAFADVKTVAVGFIRPAMVEDPLRAK